MRIHFLLTTLILLFILIPCVYAGEEVNLTDLPKKLAEMLTISETAAQYLTAGIFLCLFMFPTFMLTKNIFAHLMVGLVILGFCTVMGWIPVFIIIILVLVVAGLLAVRFKEIFT